MAWIEFSNIKPVIFMPIDLKNLCQKVPETLDFTGKNALA